MIKLVRSLAAWGTADFKAVLKHELEQLGVAELPLQQGLTKGSHALDSDIEVMVINFSENETTIHAKAAIFYKSMIAGCSCDDDPTPIDEVNEHCEVEVDINKSTAVAVMNLLSS